MFKRLQLKSIFICSMIFVLAMSISIFAGEANNYKAWNLDEYVQETGNKIAKFNEAPEMAKKVKSGELPPVEERLPKNPIVVQPTGSIGKYGGIVRGWGTNPNSYGNNVWSPRMATALVIAPNHKDVYCGVFENYELTNDNKVLTVHLREGMKWSDGEPFTSDDIMFWWEDIQLNKELTPVVFPNWSPGGEPMDVEKIDDYTVRFTFAVSNPTIIGHMTDNEGFWAPKHYLKQFHIDYNKDAQKMAEKEDFNKWYQLLGTKIGAEARNESTDPDCPSLDPWVVSRIDKLGNKYYERNPYYFKVDIAGNQLPYINGQVRVYIPTKEQIALKAIAGEVDFGSDPFGMSEVAVLRSGEDQGNYRVVLMPGTFGTLRRYQFNYTIKDPVLNEIFNDIRFRKAMSLAINREEINKTLEYGLGIPRQYTTPSITSFYEDWMGKYYAEYDPERANELLDEMGLKWNSDQTIRLRPDGKPLKIQLIDATKGEEEFSEMVVSFWKDVGVDINYKKISRELLVQQSQTNDLEVTVWYGDAIGEMRLHNQSHVFLRPPFGSDTMRLAASLWWEWEKTGGERGIEPPEKIKKLIDVTHKWIRSSRGTEEYDKYGREMLKNAVEGLWVIGVVGEQPKPLILKNGLNNFPEDMPWVDHLIGGQADQWYWEDPENH